MYIKKVNPRGDIMLNVYENIDTSRIIAHYNSNEINFCLQENEVLSGFFVSSWHICSCKSSMVLVSSQLKDQF